MLECRHCRERVHGSVSSFGSRCPRCRLPLYERCDPPQPLAPPTGDVPRCAVHRSSPAIGTCQSCGASLCAVCRTRWYQRFLCLPCLEHLLERRPEEARVLRGQAMLSLLLGIGCWSLVVLGGWALSAGSGLQPRQEMRVMGYLLVLASFLPALFGVGQGAAAVRGALRTSAAGHGRPYPVRLPPGHPDRRAVIQHFA